jgi:hypothetical protein
MVVVLHFLSLPYFKIGGHRFHSYSIAINRTDYNNNGTQINPFKKRVLEKVLRKVNRENGITFHNLHINSEHTQNQNSLVNMMVNHAQKISGKRKLSLQKSQENQPIESKFQSIDDPHRLETKSAKLNGLNGWSFDRKQVGTEHYLNFNHPKHGSVAIKPNVEKNGYVSVHNGKLVGGFNTIGEAGMQVAQYLKGLR